MKKTKEDYRKLLKETADFYSEDVSRRALNEMGRCRYLVPENGNMCAFGRCMIDPENVSEGESVTQFGLNPKGPSMDEVLKDEYKGYHLEFWRDLQRLHDDDSNWDENGLTRVGADFVLKIYTNIDRGDYEQK